MNEYIKREDALDAILFSLVGTGHQGIAIRAVKDVPAADVVEVVRCKDCKHKNPNCYKCLRDNLWHDAEDFCSYGERKE